MPGLIRRERAAILAVAIDRPVERQIALEAAVARQMRDDLRVVARDEDAVGDRRANRDRILRVRLIRRQRHDDAIRHVARQPAQHLPPEARERLIVRRRRRDPSANSTNPASGTRPTGRDRSADRRAPAARTTRSGAPGSPARPPGASDPVISMTAPGFTSRMRFTVVTVGSVFHRCDGRRRRSPRPARRRDSRPAASARP